MGVPLTPILARNQTSLKALSGKSFVIDANIELHQFLALIRKPDGTVFSDSSGRVTSHLIGLLTRTTRLITDYNMKLIFVFDGRPNPLKRRVVDERRKAREKAQEEYTEAVLRGDFSRAWSKAVMTGRVTGGILEDAKRLLGLMGVPWLEAPEDAEAQASQMVRKGDGWAVGSKDYDCLLYGAPVLARYLTLTGREFLPAKRLMRPLIPELIRLEYNLNALGITREQLVDLAILIGTDFNEGIKGIGPKKALNLIRKHGSIEELPAEVRSNLQSDFEIVREVFLHPNVLDTYELRSPRPDMDELVGFLSGERGFSEERVKRVATRLLEAYREKEGSLGEWLS